MLACWACEYRFNEKQILRDGLLKGRSARSGGPFRLYSCPRCFKTSRVELTSKDRMFASPPRDFSVVDYLFGWLDVLSPKDFLRVIRWYQLYSETRRHFFERDGDALYSKPSITGTIRQFLSGRNSASDLEFEEWRRKREEEAIRERVREERRRERARSRSDQERGGESSPTPPPPEREVPHPYRILGVALDASEVEIRTAFKRLVRQHHPDKQSTQDPEVLERANRRLQELLAAYEELSAKR